MVKIERKQGYSGDWHCDLEYPCFICLVTHYSILPLASLLVDLRPCGLIFHKFPI